MDSNGKCKVNKKTIFDKLFEIQSMWLSVRKSGYNPHFKSKYVPLKEYIKILKPILIEKKILLIHRSINGELMTELINIESTHRVNIHACRINI